ncbi:MAG: 2-oxoacid:acceptor oxidoreductase family protein [Oscillospiraceae bacterium]|nr:2-oxoacid:acceptor oxidoreductase family protein [Oscillospiraceae bacterium]
MNYNILLAGFGGQGVLFAGKLLAYCALIAEKEISWLPSYGPEMRGGTCNCSVCISDEPIGSPLVTEPNVFVALNQPSFDKFIGKVKEGGKAFVDSTLVETKTDRTDIECFYVPATQLETDNDLPKGSNIILLGKVLKETGMFTDEVIRKALEKIVPPAKAFLIDNNLRAIGIGRAQ